MAWKVPHHLSRRQQLGDAHGYDGCLRQLLFEASYSYGVNCPLVRRTVLVNGSYRVRWVRS
jgi:hypothetical protein